MDQKFDLQNSIKEKNNNYSIFAKCKNQNLTRPTEISYPHFTNGQTKNISLTFQ